MKNKKCLIILFAVFSILGASYLGYEYYNFKTYSSAILPGYPSVSALAESTPTVIRCKVNGSSTEFTYDNMGFIKTQVDVKCIIEMSII